MSQKQNYINHIGIAIDASGSMAQHAASVVKVVDNLVADLGRQSKTFEQETRISVWSFTTLETRQGYSGITRDTRIDCLIWDMDVLRVPSIKGKYRAEGGTPLIDAGITAINDLKLVTEKYGDHSFLLYLITDGDENTSKNGVSVLQGLIKNAGDNWTVAALVPDVRGKGWMEALGVPKGNISIWDTQSRTGFEELGQQVQAATSSYMTQRSTGTRATKTLFAGAATVNTATMAAAKLEPLDPSTYKIVPVIFRPDLLNAKGQLEIMDFVKSINEGKYRLGQAWYPVVKDMPRPVRITPQKRIAVMHNKTKMVYTGKGVRSMLGLPEDGTVSVRADTNPDYTVYVESHSTNRHLTPNSSILLFP